MKKPFARIALTLGSATLVCLATTGCHDMDHDNSGSDSGYTNHTSYPAPTAPVVQTADADNSRQNQGDRNNATLTPGDQGNSPADRDITQRIRQAVVNADNYSTMAKNVKIITVNGRVTLRGPVQNESEKTGIATFATNVAGPGNVDDQLEVKSSQ